MGPSVRSRGFTLIELMIVVAIIGVLAAIAIPKFAELIRKSNEGSTKGNLGAVRSALTIYYGDMEGVYPDLLPALTISGKYLGALPLAKTPSYHPDSAAVQYGVYGGASDAGGWEYNDFPNAANYGNVWVNCNHTDSKGSIWTSY